MPDDVRVDTAPLASLLRRNGSGVWTSTCVVRRDAVLRCGGFDERMRLCEDLRLWFRLAFEGAFVAVREPLVKRGALGTDNLCYAPEPLVDWQYAVESAALRLEVFSETYARATGMNTEVCRRLREMIGESLKDLGMCYAITKNNRIARRKGLEAIAFGDGRTAAIGFLLLCAPWAAARIYRRGRLAQARTTRIADVV